MFHFLLQNIYKCPMKNKLFSTPKLKFFYSLLLFQIVLYSVLRIAFLIFFKNEISTGTEGLIFDALLLGVRFDIRLAMFVLIPGLVFVNLPLNPSFKYRAINWIYGVTFAIITFLYVTDFGYYSYLKSRLNSTIISFLGNPVISFEMVRESYPWILLTLLIIALATLVVFLYKNLVANHLTPPLFHKPEKGNKTSVVFFLVLFALGIYGSFQMYPLRWSVAFASTDTFSSNLSLNPILYVSDTYSFRTAEYDETLTKDYYPVVSDFLGVDQPNLDQLNFVRSFSGHADIAKTKPNIVYIVMESLAWYKTGTGGSGINPTPNLDNLTKESVLFTNFYTPTVATARSIFSAITSLPDTSKVKTGSRNPMIVNQHAIMGEFEGYQKYYFLGGSANWGNIRGIFNFNIPGIQILEEGSYDSPRVDVWGISDLSLFKESIKKINEDKTKEDKPFFAFIQTAGFHRPYTIPAGESDFVTLTEKDISEADVKKYGFDSLAEYNAMRLQDHSLGQFIALAKKEGWYDNTIFLIHGDHGLPHNNALNVAEWQKSASNSYHVPFIIHSPKRLAPAIEEKIASEVDVMSTIAGLAGIPYSTRALGRDLFNPEFDNYRAAFSYSWYAPFNISLIDHEFYYEFIPGGEAKLVKYSEAPDDKDIKDQYPEKFKQMDELAKGLYETSRYLLHHNQKIEKKNN